MEIGKKYYLLILIFNFLSLKCLSIYESYLIQKNYTINAYNAVLKQMVIDVSQLDDELEKKSLTKLIKKLNQQYCRKIAKHKKLCTSDYLSDRLSKDKYTRLLNKLREEHESICHQINISF